MGLISRVSSRTYRFQVFSQNLKQKKTSSKKWLNKSNPNSEPPPSESKAETNWKNKSPPSEKNSPSYRSPKSPTAATRSTKSRLSEKNIAKTLTVLNQSQKAELQKFYRGKSFKPTDLKPRKTRALRRRLNKAEEGAKKLKQIRREQKTAVKKFALKA